MKTASRIAASTRREGECLVWKKYIDRHGYGRIRVDGSSLLAHRYTYEVLVGPIGDGLVLDHLCRNRACVNPEHLEPVTLAENTARGLSPVAANAAKTHCPAGHPYDAANTYTTANGYRDCRECSRVEGRAQYAKRRLKIARTCAGPDCHNIIPVAVRADRRTCSERCKSRLKRAAERSAA